MVDFNYLLGLQGPAGFTEEANEFAAGNSTLESKLHKHSLADTRPAYT